MVPVSMRRPSHMVCSDVCATLLLLLLLLQSTPERGGQGVAELDEDVRQPQLCLPSLSRAFFLLCIVLRGSAGVVGAWLARQAKGVCIRSISILVFFHSSQSHSRAVRETQRPL